MRNPKATAELARTRYRIAHYSNEYPGASPSQPRSESFTSDSLQFLWAFIRRAPRVDVSHGSPILARHLEDHAGLLSIVAHRQRYRSAQGMHYGAGHLTPRGNYTSPISLSGTVLSTERETRAFVQKELCRLFPISIPQS